jgi:hypothetical protein
MSPLHTITDPHFTRMFDRLINQVAKVEERVYDSRLSLENALVDAQQYMVQDCQVELVRGSWDEMAYRCYREHKADCSDCGISICSKHDEECPKCHESFCPGCLSYHEKDCKG